MQHDIRWRHRFENMQKAFKQLDQALEISQPNIVERAGIILMFTNTAELAWNTLMEYLSHQGISEITGSRDAIRKAFKHGLLIDGMNWMKMLESRSLTSQAYLEEIAAALLTDIQNVYHGLFMDLMITLQAIIDSFDADNAI